MAPSAIANHRIYDEAAARADRGRWLIRNFAPRAYLSPTSFIIDGEAVLCGHKIQPRDDNLPASQRDAVDEFFRCIALQQLPLTSAWFKIVCGVDDVIRRKLTTSPTRLIEARARDADAAFQIGVFVITFSLETKTCFLLG